MRYVFGSLSMGVCLALLDSVAIATVIVPSVTLSSESEGTRTSAENLSGIAVETGDIADSALLIALDQPLLAGSEVQSGKRGVAPGSDRSKLTLPKLRPAVSDASQFRLLEHFEVAQLPPEPADPDIDAETETETPASTEPTIRINVTEELLNQPVYSPFRREGTLRESTQPVYVIDRDQIEAQGARTVDEALRYLPGILSEGTAGGQLGTLSGQFIRGGVSAQTLILLDGRPLNEIGNAGAFDLSDITTDAVEQIEVLPGGGSVLYGSSAIGGVINIITRSSRAPLGFDASANAELGSFGHNRQSLEVRQNDGLVSVNLGYSRTASDNDFDFELDTIDFSGTRSNADVLYNNANLGLQIDLNERNRLRFGALFLSKDLGVPGGVPIPDLAPFNSLTEDDRQYTESWLLDLALESELGQGDDSFLTTRFFADFEDFTFNNPDDPFSPDRDEVDQRSLGVQVQHNWQFAENQNITYGLDYRNVDATNETLNLLTDTTTENFSGTINQTALFDRYQANFTERFGANFGIRQDFNDLADSGFTSFNVGLKVDVTDTTTFRTNFARNFRVPTLSNLFFAPFNNPDLESENGLSFDVGFDQQLGDRGLLRFTFFRNEINDAITFDLVSFTPQNIGRVRTIGIETEATLQLFDNIFAFANYTWNSPRIEDDPDPANNGNTLPFVDADTLNLGLSYENEGLYTAVFLRHVSDFFVDRSNDNSLDGRLTVDWKLRAPIFQNFSLQAAVNNIFDEQFEEFPGFPGVGRNFQLGIRSTF
ncbi:MAG: TonB-dependent receptor [Cyanobacteria bacterium P01_H01_bin.152]